MAIEAKVSLVNLLEEKLADVLTAKSLQSVLAVMSEVLDEYLWRRKDKNEALFVSLKTGDRLKPNGARMALRRCGEEAGVYNVHPHRFRRTLATELCRQGMSIAEVSRILGHCKIDTTLKYVSLDDEDIRSTYNKYRK